MRTGAQAPTQTASKQKSINGLQVFTALNMDTRPVLQHRQLLMSKVRGSKTRRGLLGEVIFQDDVIFSVSSINVIELAITTKPTRMLEMLKAKASLEFLWALLQSPTELASRVCGGKGKQQRGKG